ncbi:MAG: hypothetical protein QOI11_1549, partial [Candidatus Eremiobacteraeota bacterium]|nr:hypothetical protein [Candidatus Eremiobacteraeota bacterium]
ARMEAVASEDRRGGKSARGVSGGGNGR